MKKNVALVLVFAAVLVIGFYFFSSYMYEQKQSEAPLVNDYRQTEFMIEGERRRVGEELEYFGNELRADLNNDGREDVVFLVTYSPGGSGTFFYVVAALGSEEGYVGSDGYLLGDRIAPQTTVLSENPVHKNVIAVQFADRNPGESMTTSPSVGKSAYLKIDAANLWGVVEPETVGEADLERMTLGMKAWVWQRALYNDGREIIPKDTSAFTLTFAEDNSFSITTDCNSGGGAYSTTDNLLTLTDIFSTLMYCEGAQEADFTKLLENTTSYFFTDRGELILELKYDSGTVTFK